MVAKLLADATALCSTDGTQHCNTGLPTVSANGSALNTILSIVFGVLAVVCVLLIVIGCLRLLEAQGDPQGVKKGRNTIVYAILGLVLALSAETIVIVVLNRL